MKTRGWVHLDLKLDNVLLSGLSPTVKLADFGFAFNVTSDAKQLPRGSLGFVAPEILESETYDFAADMFSLGVIAFTLLTGKAPFTGSSKEELREANRLARVEFKDEDWRVLSPLAADFTRRLLKKFPNNRMTVEEASSHPWVVCSSPIHIKECEFVSVSLDDSSTQETMDSTPPIVSQDFPSF